MNDLAPEWIDGDQCSRCQSQFTTFNRKHHCRNCGRIFDYNCCYKLLALPHLNFKDPVRVCEGCYSLILRDGTKAAPPSTIRKSTSNTQQSSNNYKYNEDKDLLKAIQLSLADSNHHVPSQPPVNNDRPFKSNENVRISEDEQMDNDLKLAIEASLRDVEQPKPSAPIIEREQSTQQQVNYPNRSSSKFKLNPSFELNPSDHDAILTFAQNVEQSKNNTSLPSTDLTYDADRALNAKSRLLQGVNETEAKERLLMEMNAKMSESVRLYNRLLESQIEKRQQRRSFSPELQQQFHSNSLPPMPNYQRNHHIRSPSVVQSTPIPTLPFSNAVYQQPQQQAEFVSSPIVAPSAPDLPEQITPQQYQPPQMNGINGVIIPQQQQPQPYIQQPQPQQLPHSYLQPRLSQQQSPQQQQQPSYSNESQRTYNALAELPSAPSTLVQNQPQQQQYQNHQPQQEAMLIEL